MQNYMHKRNAGYTIDQTILIVAIIAILITLIIGTVGWDLINRTGGAKLASQLRQIEDSNGQFFARHQVWPHQGSDNPTSDNNMLILQNKISSGDTILPVVANTNPINSLVGLSDLAGVLQHNFGGGGTIQQQLNTLPASMGLGTGEYLVVQFTDVPFSEAQKADETIDGSVNNQVGRVVYQGTTDGDCLNATGGGAMAAISATPTTTGNVNLCYASNLIQ